jgi:hypothetical protein
MHIQIDHACTSVQTNKDIGKVKCSESAKAGRAQRFASRTLGDSLHTSPVAQVMSREFSRIRSKAAATPEHLAALMDRFGGSKPVDIQDTEIDAVLDAIMLRA